jgi:hypothetical protein
MRLLRLIDLGNFAPDDAGVMEKAISTLPATASSDVFAS